jgi:RNA polymerase sigma factor (sigma-70 family)
LLFESAPREIEAILRQPGASWSRQQREMIEGWLWHPSRLSTLVRLTQWHLGGGAGPEDAADALQDFWVYEFGHRHQPGPIIRSFDPSKGTFESYLLVCLKRFCWQWCARVTKEHQRVEPLAGDGSDDSVDRSVRDPGPGPEKLVEAEEQVRIVRACLERMPTPHREVIECALRGLEPKEMALALGISHTAAKVRLHRARLALRDGLAAWFARKSRADQ